MDVYQQRISTRDEQAQENIKWSEAKLTDSEGMDWPWASDDETKQVHTRCRKLFHYSRHLKESVRHKTEDG